LNKVKYTLGYLHNLINVGIRDNMLTSVHKPRWFPDALDSVYNEMLKSGNPVNNSFYKNMNADKLINHENIASSKMDRAPWNEDIESEYNICLDEGKINTNANTKYYHWLTNANIYYPHKKYANFKKYQPYFKPKGTIGDLCFLNSVGPTCLKFYSKSNNDISVCYTNTFMDRDLTCVVSIIDVGKNCKITLNEHFENKEDGIKLHKLIYLVRDGADLHLERAYEMYNKETAMNVVESSVIQFPGSKFTMNIQGEGSKHTQDILDIEIYKDCFTSVVGSYNCFDNVTNNSVVNLHHKDKNSFSRVDVKSIVDDNAHSSFLGCITVDKRATGVDAELYNKNLLLSNTATAITEPQLDINTKDINCKHGCTVSNVNKDELFYLGTRGIDPVSAEETLKKCFLTI